MPDTAVSDPFADLASEIGKSERTLASSRDEDLATARRSLDTISKQVQENYRRQAAAEKPAIEAAQAVVSQPMPKPPEAPVLQPAPSLGLRQFLAPVQGESPEASINKFIQQLGLMATFIGGFSKGSARASLAALTGALTGWQQGDKERADRAFGDWKAETDRLLTNYQTERQSIMDVINDKQLTLRDMLTGVQLSARAAGLDQLADLAKKGDLEQVVKRLESDRNHADQVKVQMARIEEMYQARLHQDQLRRDLAAMQIAANIDRDRQRAIDNAELRKDLQTAHDQTLKEIAGMRISAGQDLKPKDVLKLRDQEIGITQKLQQRERLKSAVDFLDKRGIIPKGPSYLDKAKAIANLQLAAGDQEVATKLEELQRWGTALLLSSEIATAGAASTFRIKSIAEAEAGSVRYVPKPFWDNFLGDAQDILKKRQENIRDILGSEAPAAAAPEPKESALPAGAHREGNDIVSDSGKYIWRGGAWQTR